ncbi:MAG TPA: glycosyltransferase [Polyangiales bacterium]
MSQASPTAADSTLAGKTPSVSVVICVIDPHPVYFVQAVRSILEQSVRDLELIIIEEPSSASAAPLLAGIADPRIRHYAHPQRTSLVEQRNRGIEHARAELIAVLDADDIAEPDRLQKQLCFMHAHPEVGALGTQLRLIDPSGATLGYRHYPVEPGAVTDALASINPIGQPAVMYRKALVQSLGGYRYGRYPATEDYELWCRMAATGAKLANLDEALVRYRIHPGAMKTTKLHGILRGTIEIKEQYFKGRMSARARLRLLGEKLLLHLPPPLVLRLFLATSLRRDEPRGASR